MNQTQHETRQGNIKNHYAVLLTLLLGIIISSFVFVLVGNSEKQQQQLRFQETAHEDAFRLQNKITEYLIELNAIKRLYQSSDYVDRQEFRSFVTPVLQHHPELQTLEWIPRITPGQRKQFTQQAHDAGFPHFEITEKSADNTLMAAAQRNVYYPVLYLEPSTANQAALGFDLGSDAETHEALAAARDSGMPSAAPIIPALQDSVHKQGFRFLVPVYSKNAVLDTVAQRREKLSGFILGEFRSADVIQAAIPGHDPAQISIMVIDKSEPSDERLLYSNDPAVQKQRRKTSNSAHPKGLFHYDTRIDNTGLHWQISFSSGPAYIAPLTPRQSWLSLMICLFITAWLAYYLRQNQQRTSGIESLVKQRTLELQNSEAHNRAIFSTMSEGLIICNRHGLIESFNPAAEKLYGYRANEVTGKDINILVPDKHVATYGAAFHKYLLHGESTAIGETNEFRGRRKDGSVFAIEYSISTMLAYEDKKFIITVHDITARKQAETRLARQAREARLLHQGTAIATETSSFLEALQSCIDMVCNIMEWPVGNVYVPDESTCAVIPSDIWHLDDSEKHKALYHAINSTPLPRGKGLAGKIWQTGTSQWIRDISQNPDFEHLQDIQVPIHSAVGFPIYVDYEIVAILGFYTYHALEPDYGLLRVLQILGEQVGHVFEKRRAEKAITDAEERARLILESAGEGIYGVDCKGNTIFVNPAAENMIGYSADEVIGKRMHDFIHHRYPDGSPYPLEQCHVHKVFTQGKVQHISNEVLWRKDGSSFPAEYTTTPMWKGGAIVGAVVTFRDITERLRVDKMKSEFVATVSHELRTPLTSIRGSLGLLAGGVAGELPDQALGMVEIARKNSERLLLLINDILDMEKIKSGKLEFKFRHTELIPLIEHAIESSHAYARQYGVSFRFGDHPDHVMLNIDSDRFLQIMSNLLSNAAKFSPADECVDITVEQLTEKPHGNKGAGQVRISVTDHGPGIPKQFQDQVFEKFCQADASDTRQKGGTGLGLSITKRLVEQMNGRIGFVTTAGKGTTFYFDLPDVTGAVQNTAQRRNN